MEPTQVDKVPSNVQEIPGRGETLQAARERLNETLAGVGEQARHAAKYADETVHNNPWTSIGVGFGIGVVVGALIALAAASSRNSG
jgi:ElaB/YqjD/DUF883 family membrane-anchored ribosome-binding protein